jgi:hypothetical protein
MKVVKVKELKIGTVIESGEVITSIKTDIKGKWLECVVVNRETNRFRPIICNMHKNIIIQSL